MTSVAEAAAQLWPAARLLSALSVRPAGPEDREGVVQLLAGSSADALHQRFLVGFGGPPLTALVDRLLARDASSRSVLALAGEAVVGHGMCAHAKSWQGRPAVEIALLVRDDQRGRGIGSALLYALRDEAVAMRAEWIQVTTAADNRVVTAMVRAHAPGLQPSSTALR
ncbi:GNAT family N-acetyltransferase [Nocardioides sp. InS609-2]|uniref:GNAT family N-acetyltransferase n=1 Tax=Nocardioides sp. InS609-2 TaxID=2760705 RepID=UPI0020BFB1FD|nr:GNAT family N-acetyltransferase [Nocardioides sp. InS609-2]